MAAKRHSREAYEVVLDAADLGDVQRIGTLFRATARSDLPASFEYATDWLRSERSFMLDPRLELWTGEQHPPPKLAAFGIFLDSAPDRWGRVLMERREAFESRREGRPMRRLQDLDFLLGVHDLTRSGALRFRSASGGPFLDDSPNAAPPVTSLAELARISRQLEEPGAEELPEYQRWLAMLLAPGTSLGGARPKANFTDDARLWIAKFPARDDRHDVGGWEYVAHRLAHDAGISVPASRAEQLTDRHHTFCVERFDRADMSRRMFASATTLLDAHDRDDASYLDLAEFISNQGAQDHIEADLSQLFRRVVFNVIVGNRDDHLRNHGFIRERTGWRLSPAFDLNPNPFRQTHVLTIDGESTEPDLDRVRETGSLYRLSAKKVENVVTSVRAAIEPWKERAQSLRLPRSEIQLMEQVIAAR